MKIEIDTNCESPEKLKEIAAFLISLAEKEEGERLEKEKAREHQMKQQRKTWPGLV